MTARTDAAGRHERFFATVLELDLDYCANTYGVSPCTASKSAGQECYNVFDAVDAPCQDKPTYVKTIKTYKFCTRGMQIPVGELIRPLITDWSYSPAKLDEKHGLARNHKMTVTLVDEPDSDVGIDPYVATRATPAGSTFLRRLTARNPNMVGRFARVRQGYVVDPWDWDTFETRLFVIEAIEGPDPDGRVSIVLKDSLKLAARVQVPADTGARAGLDFKAYELQGYALAAGSDTVQLPANASNVDDTYNGMGLYVAAGTGFDQYRTISDYNGSTRTATVSVAWSPHVPDTTSFIQIGSLSMTLAPGDGTKLNNPATTGDREFVRVGKEIIEYTVLSGDVISWPDLSYRGVLRTPIEDHRTGNAVQQGLAFIAERFYTVIKTLLNAAGIADSYIDTTGFQSEDDTWLGERWRLTWVFTKPEDVDRILRKLLYPAACVMWWDLVSQKVKLKKLAPQFTAPAVYTDAGSIRQNSMMPDFRHDERLTRAGMGYDLIHGTEDGGKLVNYFRWQIIANLDQESANGQNAVKSELTGVEVFGEGNDVAAAVAAGNVLAHRLNVPIDVKFQLDPKDQVYLGDQVDIETAKIIDGAGNKKRTRILVTYVNDRGTHYEVEGRATIYGDRFAWIADNAAGDYPTDSSYAHISQNDGLMAVGGDKGYGICP